MEIQSDEKIWFWGIIEWIGGRVEDPSQWTFGKISRKIKEIWTKQAFICSSTFGMKSLSHHWPTIPTDIAISCSSGKSNPAMNSHSSNIPSSCDSSADKYFLVGVSSSQHTRAQCQSACEWISQHSLLCRDYHKVYSQRQAIFSRIIFSERRVMQQTVWMLMRNLNQIKSEKTKTLILICQRRVHIWLDGEFIADARFACLITPTNLIASRLGILDGLSTLRREIDSTLRVAFAALCAYHDRRFLCHNR